MLIYIYIPSRNTAPDYPALLCNGFCCYLKLMDCLFTCSVLHHILKSVSFLVFHSLKQAIKKLEYACPWVQNSFQWKNEVPDPTIDAARSMFPFASVSSRASKKKETLISSINVRPSWHARIKLRTHTLVSSDRPSCWRTRWHCQELLESISNLVSRTLVNQGTHRHSTVNSWYTATSLYPPACPQMWIQMESDLCLNSPNLEHGTTRTKYNYYGATTVQENQSIHVAVHVRLFPIKGEGVGSRNI